MSRRGNRNQQPPAAPPPEEFAPNVEPELPAQVEAAAPIEAPVLPEISEAAALLEAPAEIDHDSQFLPEVIKRRIAAGKREREVILAAAVEAFNQEHWS